MIPQIRVTVISYDASSLRAVGRGLTGSFSYPLPSAGFPGIQDSHHPQTIVDSPLGGQTLQVEIPRKDLFAADQNFSRLADLVSAPHLDPWDNVSSHVVASSLLAVVPDTLGSSTGSPPHRPSMPGTTPPAGAMPDMAMLPQLLPDAGHAAFLTLIADMTSFNQRPE